MTEPRPARSPSAKPAKPAKQGLFRRIGAATRPHQRTRRATSYFASLFALALGGYLGVARLQTDWGPLADAGIGVGVVAVILLLFPLALALAAGLARWLPSLFGQLGIGALAASVFVLAETGTGPDLALILAGSGLVASALLFGSLAIFTSGGFKAQGFLKKSWVVLCVLVGLGGVGYGSWWQWWQSPSTAHLVRAADLERGTLPAASTAGNPGLPGSLAVKTLTYGSGKDRHRPEFGEGAALETEPVNGKPFVSLKKSFRGQLRRDYWGFGPGELPLNGRVWYPDGAGPFPLALVVHGNHYMAEYSDPGYEYLGQLLASRGIITCSVDENFLNSGGFLYEGLRKENDCRAWVLLQHLKVWRDWNAAAADSNPFAGRVAMDKITLIGHSRGGEAVCHAALFNRLPHYPDDASVEFDFGFGIQSVVAIAPSDGQYRPAGRYTAMRDVSFLTIQGGHDADVSSFVGDRLFERLRFSPGSSHFKSSLFIHRANHGQFNTVWGDSDSSEPRGWFLNRVALLPGEEQRQIAKVYISGFLAATLQGQRQYVALLRDHRTGREWLPDALMTNRYADASHRTVCDFEEDFDGSTATLAGGKLAATGFEVRREADIPLRSGGRRHNAGVFLGWNRAPAETDAAKIDGDAGVVEASAAKTAQEPPANQPPANQPPAKQPPATEPPAKKPPASYQLTLPKPLGEVWKTGAGGALVFCAAASDDKPKATDYQVRADADQAEDGEDAENAENAENEPAAKSGEDAEGKDKPATLDLTIELVAADGAKAQLPLSRFGTILPPMQSRFTTSPLIERRYKKYEPALQTFTLPFAAFVAVNEKFDPARLVEVRFVFDRTDKGFVILDAIGFALPPE